MTFNSNAIRRLTDDETDRVAGGVSGFVFVIGPGSKFSFIPGVLSVSAAATIGGTAFAFAKSTPGSSIAIASVETTGNGTATATSSSTVTS